MTRPGPLTEERKATHGEWRETAAIAASLKRVLRDEGARGFTLMEDHQTEALDMICEKIARILSGDPNHADHWDDIGGYSLLGRGGAGFQDMALDYPLLADSVAKLLEKDTASVIALGWIAQGRVRQVEAEGWSPEHDDAHGPGELGDAAACYAVANPRLWAMHDGKPVLWPWNASWWKPRSRHSNWVRAGALLVAELARHLRSAAAQGGGQ